MVLKGVGLLVNLVDLGCPETCNGLAVLLVVEGEKHPVGLAVNIILLHEEVSGCRGQKGIAHLPIFAKTPEELEDFDLKRCTNVA